MTIVLSIPESISGSIPEGSAAASAFTVLDSDANSFSPGLAVLDSDANSFTVTLAVLDSDGNSFTVT